jgi:hypothetical protein
MTALILCCWKFAQVENWQQTVYCSNALLHQKLFGSPGIVGSIGAGTLNYRGEMFDTFDILPGQWLTLACDRFHLM